MNFINNKMEGDKILQTFTRNGNYYTKKFVDGTSFTYYTDYENEEKNIRNEMILQAKLRQQLMSSKKYNLSSKACLAASIIFMISSASYLADHNIAMPFLLIMGSVCGIYMFLRDRAISKELKKYDKFLEMYEDVDTIKNWIHDFSVPILDIETLDEYDGSYVDIIYDSYLEYKDNTKDISDDQIELKKSFYPRL